MKHWNAEETNDTDKIHSKKQKNIVDKNGAAKKTKNL